MKVRTVYLVFFLLFCVSGAADAITFPIPSLSLNVETAKTPEEVAVVLEIIALLTILALAPAILILMTPFTRLIVVFHFLRQAIGTQSILNVKYLMIQPLNRPRCPFESFCCSIQGKAIWLFL